MSNELNAKIFAGLLKPIITSCPLWIGIPLHATVIANPRAGGVTITSRAEKNAAVLEQASKEAASLPQKTILTDYDVHETQYAGHSALLTADILAKAASAPEEDQWLIITAGGDGTSLEIQTALLKAALASQTAKELVTKRITIVRFPFGTGNDGSDGRTVSETLARFMSPSHFALQRAVKVSCEGQVSPEVIERDSRKIMKYDSLDAHSPWYSFNLASIGIDAFITHKTNESHMFLPGDFYKLWIDLACLFYDFSFKAGEMRVEVLNADGTCTRTMAGNLMICLLGVSGHRSYGSGQLILPDDNNFCGSTQLSLFEKLKTKKKITVGKHIGNPHFTFEKAEKIRVWYNEYILVQMDGEVHLLHPDQFPLTMERTEPIIRIIECNDAPYDKGAVAV